MFYNVENLFDTFDDPAAEDDEFTPGGSKRWTYHRYREKLNKIAKTIIAVGEWEPPDVVGLCEVENFQVLLDLTTEPPLKKFGYQIIHENSQDPRGIDNAFLYRPDKLSKIVHQATPIDGQMLNTRDILYASFAVPDPDTIHLFVNHWPSRFGGKEFTDKKRIVTARVLRAGIDSLQKLKPTSKILIMGDFNDEPAEKSMAGILQAVPYDISPWSKDVFYNLSYQEYKDGAGTLVFKEIDHTWFLFDQIIVSGTLLAGNGLQIVAMKNHIFKPEWLLKDNRPFRTYQGPIYQGGFSDHLPIFIDLYYKD